MNWVRPDVASEGWAEVDGLSRFVARIADNGHRHCEWRNTIMNARKTLEVACIWIVGIEVWMVRGVESGLRRLVTGKSVRGPHTCIGSAIEG
jgi:hypothetical protein